MHKLHHSPNGFFFLTPNQLYWYRTMSKELPQPIQDLLKHLKTTGTGQAKLDKLAAIGLKSADGNEFMLAAKLAVSDVTFAKIQEYVNQQKALAATNQPELVVDSPNTGTTPLSQSDGGELVIPPIDSDNNGLEEKDEEESDEGDLPNKGMSAADSIVAIHEDKFDKDQLEIIVTYDTRKTVVEAAQKKLDEQE